MPNVVLVGTIVEGFKFVGPFESAFQARTWCFQSGTSAHYATWVKWLEPAREAPSEPVNEPHVVIVGNPDTGYKLHGPYANSHDAEFAANTFDEQGLVAPLVAPDKF